MSKIKSTFKGNKKTKKFIPNLTATPNHICFKNYEEGKVNKEFIQIVNQDLKTYHIGIKFDNPDEIKVKVVGNSSKTLLGSGDDILLEIEFTPSISYKKESVDRRYEICLNIINANAKFLIPIIVLSPHPEINLPREITLPDVAVNTPAYSNIFILNYTNLYTKFSFECRNDVRIIPDCKVIGLKACEGSTYLIEFIPKTLGNFREKIYICMENDKRIAITLKCNVIPINIFLSEETIEFTPTFIGMSDRKFIYIVNNSEEATFFEWLPCESLYNSDNEQALQAHSSLKYVEISPMSGELQPGTIMSIDLTFKPEESDDDEFELVKDVVVSVGLRLSVTPHYHPSVNLKGLILGPSFELDRRSIEMHDLFIGECRNIEVIVRNTGIIGGSILVQKSSLEKGSIIKVSSTREFFKPNESKCFLMQFLAKKVGKFVEQIYFKEKNGEKLSFTIHGIIKPLDLAIEPKAISFPLSTMCVPQMHFLKLTNYLPFDIDVVVKCEENGSESPLEFLEFFKNNSSAFANTFNNDESDNISIESLLTRTSIRNFMEHSGRMGKIRDALSVAKEGIVEIFNKVNEYLERKEIVDNIVDALFEKQLNAEIEKRFIIEIIVELLIESINESDCTSFVKFFQKDWTIPDNPRQIDFSKTIFTISANSSDELKIFLTPNYVGKFVRNLNFHLTMNDCQHKNIDETIKIVQLSFECYGAEINIHNQTNEITGYAESEIALEILIENVSNIDGFFFLTPYEDTQMKIKTLDEKFHIAAGSKKVINLQVMPLMSGLILKYVNIVAFGSNRKFPVYIECKSLPPDIVVKPNKIILTDLDILRKDDTRIFIENRSQTKARFFLKLEHDRECFNISPRGGILSSKQCVMVMLEKFFHDPGDYRDVLILEIVNSKVIKIPIKCTVKKLPIIIEPSLSKVIDFGSLFVSKTPYFLDYKFTNGGRNAYMIFFMLKNCRNRNEIHFTIEPNRFELSPNCSQVVKFLLNAEHALNCEEEFTIEGCSIHFPIRELIWESKLKSSVIKPTINFSSNELIFNCYYGEVGDLSTERIRIENKSSLQLPVALKVEGEFSIFAKELNTCEKKLILDLNAHESREVCICFNSNLIKNSNIFCTYEGRVRAYSLGKLQCTLKLIANLIYPEIELSTNEVHFTANLFPYSHSFIISNPNEKLSASFQFTFNEGATKIDSIHEKRQENLLNIVQCLMKQKNSLRDEFFRIDSDISDIYYDADDNECSYLSPSVDKMNETIDVDVSNKDILEHFKSITVKTSENYCSYDKNTTTMSVAEVDKSFLSLSQMSGVLRAGESRLISLQFTGSQKAFNLSTIIQCQIEGGKDHDIRIQMTNCSPNILITKTFFDISHQRWQEIAINNICISNISPSSNVIKLIAEKHDVEISELIEGYVKLSSRCQTNFTLDDKRNFCCDLKFSMFPGCLPIFKSEFGMQVNEKPPIPITFYSKNSMPMITLLDVDCESINTVDKSFEYNCLREIYNKSIVRIRISDEAVNCEEILRIREQIKIIEDEIQQRKQKINRKSKRMESKRKNDKKLSIDVHSSGDCSTISKEFDLFFTNKRGRVEWRERPQILCSAKVLQIADEELEECSFIALDYPDEYPHAIEIIHFIAQYGFAKSLENDEIFKAYKSIYNRYVVEKFRHLKKSIETARKNGAAVTSAVDDGVATIEALPFISFEYSYDFGEIKIDEMHERMFRIYCHHRNNFPVGVALRSTKYIPNFSIKFNQTSEIHDLFEVKNFGEMNLSLLQDIEYESVKHCHSFDFISGNIHTRKVPRTMNERKEINRFYSEKICIKEKIRDQNPYVLAEIVQKQPFCNNESRIIEFKILFTPSSNNYYDTTPFDEIIYMDIHLGPQIPIHITGKFIQSVDHTRVDF